MDLYVGLAIVAGVSLAVFQATALLARRCSPLHRNLLAVAIVGLMIAYTYGLWQSTLLARLLPLSNLIVLGNWYPIFLSALGGVVVAMPQLCLARRGVALVSLAAFSTYAALSPLLGEPPACDNRWSLDGDCMQTTEFTCSAASAATLLSEHGIAASEREMAELCLTRRGTSWLGLYRGLKLKTEGTPWKVEIVRCTAADLRRYAGEPMILEVGLEADDHVDPAYRTEFGWVPGMKHSVILRGFTEQGDARVVDPTPNIGRERWDAETLQLLWRGHGIRLIHR
jgi:predicted double-glycine peptidase